WEDDDRLDSDNRLATGGLVAVSDGSKDRAGLVIDARVSRVGLRVITNDSNGQAIQAIRVLRRVLQLLGGGVQRVEDFPLFKRLAKLGESFLIANAKLGHREFDGLRGLRGFRRLDSCPLIRGGKGKCGAA